MFARTSVMFIVMLVLLLGTVMPLAAQEDSGSEYIVRPGDTLWALSDEYRGDPLTWRELVKMNPFLEEKGRVFKRSDGRVIVLIRPGEQLKGLLEVGISAEPVPLEQLRLASGELKHHPATEWLLEQVEKFWPYLLGALGLLLVGLVLLRRTLNADPATSRPPVIPNGILTPGEAAGRFQTMAWRVHQSRTGQAVSLQQFTVLEQTSGRIWGVMTVRYGDGREVPRRLNGERAYRGRVRFPNGQEETLYFLQACGNDLRMGGISRYLPGPEFRFEEDQPVVQPVAVPTEPQVAATPAPQPTPEPEPVATTTEEDGTTSFEYRRASAEQPALVRLRGIQAEEFTFSVRGNETVLRFREARPSATGGVIAPTQN